MRLSFLSQDERAALLAPRAVDPGPYYDHHRGKHSLCLVVDAAPLVVLIEAVARHQALYEFMSIRRVGDLRHYVRVSVVPGDEVIEEEWRRAFRYRVGNDEPMEATVVEMDEHLPLEDDGAAPLPEAWNRSGTGPLLRAWLPELLALVREVQERVRASAGQSRLRREELAKIDAGTHECDWWAWIPRKARWRGLAPEVSVVSPELAPDVPPAVTRAVLALVRGLELPAVASGYKAMELWTGLCALQMERVAATGRPPAEALALFSADGGIPLRPEDWGGDVHVSWEGMCMATLVMKPGWRVFAPERAGEDGSLLMGLRDGGPYEAPRVRFANGLECSIGRCLVLVVPDDYGELGCTWRFVVDDWFIYVEKTLGVAPERLREILGLEA